MLAGEIDAHREPNDFSGRTVAEQLLWGGASALCAEIVRMALEQVDWPPEDPRWFWMLSRPVPGHKDYNAQQQAGCCECFRLILARCGPHHRATDHGQTMLHEAVSRDHSVGVQLATILLDAGARLDVRDDLLESTPLGWACRWGRVEMVKLFLARGADPVERTRSRGRHLAHGLRKCRELKLWNCFVPRDLPRRERVDESWSAPSHVKSRELASGICPAFRVVRDPGNLREQVISPTSRSGQSQHRLFIKVDRRTLAGFHY